MISSSEINEVAAALCEAQIAFDAIRKDRTVSVKTRQGGTYTFAYAPLDTIMGAIRPALAAQGLTVIQAEEEGALTTTLLHKSGQWLANKTRISTVDANPSSSVN